MPWAFQGIETMRRAIYVMQRSMDTAAHNIANAATPGYSRQQVRSVPTDAYAMPSMNNEMGAMQIGTGIKVQAIIRIRDDYLDLQMHSASKEYGRLDMLRTYLKQTESVFNEPNDAAISAAFSKFWNSWQEVAAKPESSASRSLLITQTGELIRQAKDTSSRLHTMAIDLRAKIDTRVDEIDALTPQISVLNMQIQQAESLGYYPNDLLDERDRLLDRLAELTNFQRADMENGTLTISIGGKLIVSGHLSYALESTDDINSGEIAGLEECLDAVDDVTDKFNLLISGIINQVNTLHQSGFDANGDAGEAFFTGTDADTIALNTNIADDPNKVAAASSTPAGAGDGTNAAAIAALRQALTMSGGTVSFDDYYNSLVSALGVQVQINDGAANTQLGVVEQIDAQRQSVSGVSMDEELTNMIQFQRSYEASARCLTVMDEMMQTLISLGVGGR